MTAAVMSANGATKKIGASGLAVRATRIGEAAVVSKSM